jgi:hypothetical protein
MSVSGLLLTLLALHAAPASDAPRVRHAPQVQRVTPHGGDTPCEACHATSGWTDVRFNHEPTGYPLTGQHVRTACKACHPVDFKALVPRTCIGCHIDVHAGDLGAHCEGCHETQTWRSRFDTEAHQRTNFPLLGAHAALPCTECHGEARERRFTRATVDCNGCHQAQALSTSGRLVDHLRLGFSTRGCRECHGPVSFKPARYAEHDGCYVITAGPHANVGCAGCHTALPGGQARWRTQTATLCVGCHTNRGATATGGTDAQHKNVPGYTYTAHKCAECHAGAGGL